MNNLQHAKSTERKERWIFIYLISLSTLHVGLNFLRSSKLISEIFYFVTTTAKII